MSHSRQTEHYELPLYDGTDIINPLTDFNNANSSIDEALYNANQRSVGAENTANEAKDIAEGYDSRVAQAIQTADDAMTLASNTQDMIAEDFDPNKAGGYNVGDFVIYNGKLYKFINAHTGAWDASDVQVSPVLIEAIADVVDEGKQAIADAVDDAEQEIAGQTEKVTKTQAMIAPPFDANKDGGYAVGDAVTYADKLYKFTSAHSGAWTGLDVEQDDVVGEINNVDAKVEAVDDRVDEVNSSLNFNKIGTIEMASTDLQSTFCSQLATLLSDKTGMFFTTGSFEFIGKVENGAFTCSYQRISGTSYVVDYATNNSYGRATIPNGTTATIADLYNVQTNAARSVDVYFKS